MKTSAFRDNLNRQIEQEREKNKKLLNRTGQLEKQIKVLVEDSVVLLKARMAELGINTSSQNDLLCKAKEIVGKHKELQQAATKIQNQVQALEEEQSKYVNFHVKKLAEKNQQNPMDFESASKASLNLVLKEIDNTFNQRQKLKNHISSLEAEVVNIERNSEDIKIKTELAAKNSNSQQSASVYVATNAISQPTFKQTHVATAKTSRKNRDHRAKSNDWPDVPDVDKIEEKNPELLAQKILETGRQIEAGKLLATNQYKAKNEPFYTAQQKKSVGNVGNSSQQMMTQLMNAPHTQTSKISKLQQSSMATMVPVKIVPVPMDSVESSPKMVNFEDRLKSIITTALQEKGQEQSSSSTPTAPIPHSMHLAHSNKKLQSVSPKKINYPAGSSANWNIASTQAILSVIKPSLTISPSQISPNKARHAHMMSDYPAELNYGLKVRPEHMPNFAKSMASIHPNDLSKMMFETQTNYQQQLIQSQIQQQQQLYIPTRDHQMIFQRTVDDKREFKTPDNIRYERQVDLGRSSVGSIENEFINNSNSNSGKPSGQMQQRSSSSLSQPDYTQVSPAKLALRRHLSQEKLQSSTLPCKTIGDMINGEIHRVMEISQQSIINATINNSTQPGISVNHAPMRQSENAVEREMDNHSPYSMSKMSKQPQFLPEHYQSSMVLDQHNRNISNIRTVTIPQHISPHPQNVQKFVNPKIYSKICENKFLCNLMNVFFLGTRCQLFIILTLDEVNHQINIFYI